MRLQAGGDVGASSSAALPSTPTQPESNVFVLGTWCLEGLPQHQVGGEGRALIWVGAWDFQMGRWWHSVHSTQVR
jgi:hypothetical protein